MMRSRPESTSEVAVAQEAAFQNAAREMNESDFRLFRALIYREAGIAMSDAKRPLLVGRLSRRVRGLGLRSFREYYDHVVGGDGSELVALLDAVCTNETQFFREPQQFAFLARQVFPAWEERIERGLMPKRIRVWSAGCSTGEEPYSLAMLLLERFPAEKGFDVRVLGTDLSTKVLRGAKAGVWGLERASSIPERLLKRFMLRGCGSQTGKMKVGGTLRNVVSFARLNLNDKLYPGMGTFDLIFCRNVLIYFDRESRHGVIQRFRRHLGPGGHLFLGHAETLNGMCDWLRPAMPTVYTWAEGESPTYRQPRSGACASEEPCQGAGENRRARHGGSR